MSAFSEKSYENLWPKLSAENKISFKTKIFQILEQEQNQQIRHNICDSIGEVGGSLMSPEENNGVNEWPELP